MPKLMNVQDTAQEKEKKVFLRDETERLLKRLESLTESGGSSFFVVSNYWQGELRWARNRASMTSDRRDTTISVNRTIRGGSGGAMTNQLDDASLIGAIRSAERRALKYANRATQDMAFDLPSLSAMQTTTWSDATLARTMQERAAFVQAVTEEAEHNTLLSAGYLESRGVAVGSFVIDEYGRKESFYGQMTQAQCSATVRHPQGTSSGWAGLSGYDITKIDEQSIAKRALDKCLSSLNPVRIEPGRYTTILEPQAVADLMEILMGAVDRYSPEHVPPNIPPNMPAGTPFFLQYDATVSRDRSKLGQRMIDERITVSHDPSDPLLGVLPVKNVKPITWFKNGVLQTLNYDRGYALNELNDNEAASGRAAYRMSGSTTTMDEMIATTKRGLIVTRLASVRMVDRGSLLSTGLTRDGLWLVENGKISKAVRNFRFTESPLFVLNNVVDLGVPTPVFRPSRRPQYAGFAPVNGLMSAIVPPLKVNDFSFTSTVDAI